MGLVSTTRLHRQVTRQIRYHIAARLTAITQTLRGMIRGAVAIRVLRLATLEAKVFAPLELCTLQIRIIVLIRIIPFAKMNSYSQSDVRYWAGYIARLTFANYTLYFKDDHIWPRHLACYLPGTNDQFYQAVRDDFFKIYLQGTSPAPGGTEDYRIQYGSTSVIYRVYAVTADQYYSVGTAFIPGLPNCPGY